MKDDYNLPKKKRITSTVDKYLFFTFYECFHIFHSLVQLSLNMRFQHLLAVGYFKGYCLLYYKFPQKMQLDIAE